MLLVHFMYLSVMVTLFFYNSTPPLRFYRFCKGVYLGRHFERPVIISPRPTFLLTILTQYLSCPTRVNASINIHISLRIHFFLGFHPSCGKYHWSIYSSRVSLQDIYRYLECSSTCRVTSGLSSDSPYKAQSSSILYTVYFCFLTEPPVVPMQYSV